MKYFFILGRNVELSKLEVFSYFEKEENKILNFSLAKNCLMLDLEKPLEKGVVDFFGGVVSIGKLLVQSEKRSFEKLSDQKEIYFGTRNNFNYLVWNFSKDYDFVLLYLKQRFRQEKFKATLKHLTKNMNSQEENKIKIPSSKLLDEEYIVFDFENQILLGRIYEKCDYNKIEKRDMEKPVRREELAISPRLAKIMINLSKIKEGETLLDPFCGVGTILSEALLQKINIIGIDKDKKAVESAEQNLKWFGFSKEKFLLKNDDSRKVQIPNVDAIATEPDLGEILKKTPTEKSAKETLEKFENLMNKILKNFNKNLNGRIVFTSPCIRVGKKRIGCDIEKIISSVPYKVINKIPEYRKNQIVGREIFVLEK